MQGLLDLESEVECDLGFGSGLDKVWRIIMDVIRGQGLMLVNEGPSDVRTFWLSFVCHPMGPKGPVHTVGFRGLSRVS